MEIKKATDKDLPAICRMVSARMLDSVEASYQLDGISDKPTLVTSFMDTQIELRHRTGEVWVVGDNQGLLAGYYKKDFSIFSSVRMGWELLRRLRKNLSKADRSRLTSNLRKTDGAQDIKWRKQVCGNSDYYFIDLIVIDKSLKGSGAFRQLIEPVLLRAKSEKMPVLLDTHDKDNVQIYRHFGFELVCEHRAKRNHSMVQYSMIKRP